MAPFFKKREFFSAAEKERIVTAIHLMEQETSGEIRVFVENKNPLVNPVERARQAFHKLRMEHTKRHNAVLLYVAVKHKELAIFADEGIYTATGPAYWNDAVRKIIAGFKSNDICGSIVQAIYHTGQLLKEKFPYDPSTDTDELPGSIIFEK